MGLFLAKGLGVLEPTPHQLYSPLLSFQIDDPNSHLEEAATEVELAAQGSQLGSQQAVSADYADTGYEPGQLYPWPLGSDALTLTNSVPMNPSFREHWHESVQHLLQRALLPQCAPHQDLYLLVGAVPSEHTLGGRVAVPELVWLAACCAVPGGGWALGFVLHPRAGAVIEDVMLKDLERLLPTNPQLFHNNCGEAEQDTEKLRKILEAVTQVQEEERAALAEGSPQTLPVSAPKPPEEEEEEAEAQGSLLGRLLGLLATPFVKLLQLLYALVLGAFRGVLHLLWFSTKYVTRAVEGGLYRLGSGTASYLLAIGSELVVIPWKVIQVLLRVLGALLRILCCLLKIVCRILGLPVRVLLDVAAFPVHTVGAIPAVCKDIAVGLGGTLALFFNMASGTVGGLLQVLLGVCRRIGPRVPLDSTGDL